MYRVTALKKKRAEVLDGMDAILAKAREEDRDLSAEESSQFDALKAEDDKLTAAIATEEDLERRRAAAARPAPALPGASGPSVPVQPAAQLEPGIGFARVTQALIHGNMDQRAAADWAEKTWGTDSGQIVANLEQSTDTKGGFLVDTIYSRDFIGLLRPRVVVRRMGARNVPMPEGNLTLRKKTGGTQAAYVGERANIPTTGLTVGQNNLSAKRLAALVPITNQLLRRASQEVDAMVRDDLLESVGVKEDQQFIRGTGTATAPAGLLNLAAAANKFNATDVSAMTAVQIIQAVRNDLSKLKLKLMQANIPMTTCGFIMSPWTHEWLSNLTDANGNLAFPELAADKLGSYPCMHTTSVPDNLGAGGNESEIYFADFNQVLIADTYRVTIAASDVAAYDDGGGMKSAFQTDETLIRVIEEHDLGTRYDTAIAVLQAVKWGK